MTLQIEMANGSPAELGAASSREPAELRPTARDYVVVGALLAGTVATCALATRDAGGVTTQALRAPMAGMLLLTALVWLAMALVRNFAVLLGPTDAAYYVDYKTRPPPDWVERPARAFNNLMQLPMLFYVACLLMMQGAAVDAGQVRLAWLFVGLRALHAGLYIAWNRLPSRFGSYVASSLVLVLIWVRILSS
jgi:hypothetical protein